MDKEKSFEKIMELAQLSLRFGRVDRATFHEDGVMPESDTDHTVMLSLLACSVAHSYLPYLDVGKIAQLALVHDLVEVYAGDTPTFKPLSVKEKKEKDRKEHDAFFRIKKEFGEVFPWIHERIQEYEDRKSPESRFVKVIDKLVPKLTHILNDGAIIKNLSISKEDKVARYKIEAEWAEEALKEFPEFKKTYLSFLNKAEKLSVRITSF